MESLIGWNGVDEQSVFIAEKIGMRKLTKKEVDEHAKRLADKYIAGCSVDSAVKVLNKAWHLAVAEKKRQKIKNST